MDIIVSGQDTLIKLSDDNGFIDLSILDGWHELNADQRKYMGQLAKDPFNKTLTAMKTGVSMSTINHWLNSDYNFKAVQNQIMSIYKENLESIDYAESQSNSKTRGKTITRLREDIEGKKSSGSKHVHFHGVTAKDIINGELED